MIEDFLIDTIVPVDTLTLERQEFIQGYFFRREGERRFDSRYSWNTSGKLTSIEKEDGVQLFAYNDHNYKIAHYRLDVKGEVQERELWEWDSSNRLKKRSLKTKDDQNEIVWTYSHDKEGRMIAERQGDRVRVERRNEEGRLVQEYLYDENRVDLVIRHRYDAENRRVSTVIGKREGEIQRETRFAYDEEGRPKSEIVFDSEGRRIKDELYTYGAARCGDMWLECTVWVPGPRRKRRPLESIFRSFTFSEFHPLSEGGGNGSKDLLENSKPGSVAFKNGVYRGELKGRIPEGYGVFQYNDSSRYEGEFRNGLMEGFGRLSWPDGRAMEGNFSAGRLEGQGCCKWADGSSYLGEFQGGKMHGMGVFTWANGECYEGKFNKGRRV